MWKSCKGFTLVETLSALIIWLMIAAIIFPSFLSVLVERKNIMLEREARLLLQDVVQTMRTDQLQSSESMDIKKEGVQFTVSKIQDKAYSSVCISYYDYKNRIKEQCEWMYVEKE